jgi:hypothetical protein
MDINNGHFTRSPTYISSEQRMFWIKVVENNKSRFMSNAVVSGFWGNQTEGNEYCRIFTLQAFLNLYN